MTDWHEDLGQPVTLQDERLTKQESEAPDAHKTNARWPAPTRPSGPYSDVKTRDTWVPSPGARGGWARCYSFDDSRWDPEDGYDDSAPEAYKRALMT